MPSTLEAKSKDLKPYVPSGRLSYYKLYLCNSMTTCNRTCDYNENIYNFSEYSAEIIWKENLIFCLLYVPKGHIFQLAEIEIEYQLGVKHVCILEIPMKLCMLKTLMI